MFQKVLDQCALKKTVLLKLVKKSGFLRILEKVKRVSNLTLSLSFGKTSYFIFSFVLFCFFHLKPSHFPWKVKCNLDFFFPPFEGSLVLPEL